MLVLEEIIYELDWYYRLFDEIVVVIIIDLFF